MYSYFFLFSLLRSVSICLLNKLYFCLTGGGWTWWGGFFSFWVIEEKQKEREGAREREIHTVKKVSLIKSFRHRALDMCLNMQIFDTDSKHNKLRYSGMIHWLHCFLEHLLAIYSSKNRKRIVYIFFKASDIQSRKWTIQTVQNIIQIHHNTVQNKT